MVTPRVSLSRTVACKIPLATMPPPIVCVIVTVSCTALSSSGAVTVTVCTVFQLPVSSSAGAVKVNEVLSALKPEFLGMTTETVWSASGALASLTVYSAVLPSSMVSELRLSLTAGAASEIVTMTLSTATTGSGSSGSGAYFLSLLLEEVSISFVSVTDFPWKSESTRTVTVCGRFQLPDEKLRLDGVTLKSSAVSSTVILTVFVG